MAKAKKSKKPVKGIHKGISKDPALGVDDSKAKGAKK